MFPLLYLVSVDQNVASFDPCVELWEFFVVAVCSDTGADPVAPVVDSADQVVSVEAVGEHDSSVEAAPVEGRNFVAESDDNKVDVFDKSAGGSAIWEIVATRY